MTQAKNLAKGGSNFDSSGVLGVAGGGTGATTQAAAAAAVLPSQTGNTGKYLTTNGTDTSWGTVTSNPGTVTSVSGTAPVSVATGTSTPVISMAAATAADNGYMTSTYASKLDGISAGATVNTLTAGTGISVSASTGAATIANTGVTSVNGQTGAVTVSSSSGTVTSVATGNGLSGGTITTSGTLTVACPTYNTVGSYGSAYIYTPAGNLTGGANYAAGGSNGQFQFGVVCQDQSDSSAQFRTSSGMSGTWKWMGPTRADGNQAFYGIACRVS